MTDGQTFDQVFGSASSRIRPILGGQATWDQFQTYGLQFVQQEFGPPSQYIYAMAIAPYIGPTGTITASTTLATLFADMQNFPRHVVRADCHGQCHAGESIRRAAGGL